MQTGDFPEKPLIPIIRCDSQGIRQTFEMLLLQLSQDSLIARMTNRSNEQNCNVWFHLALLLMIGMAACSWGEGVNGSESSVVVQTPLQARDWKKFINECIARVEKSEMTFYSSDVKVTGKDVAKKMREHLRRILSKKMLPDPFERNTAVTLAMITTHDGVYREGLTYPSEPYAIEINGQRVKVYDWLKMEFDVAILPGEEEGHEVVEKQWNVANLNSNLLTQWEEYLDKCIEVVRDAKGITFSMKGKICTQSEVVVLMVHNRTNVIKWLKSPDIKNRREYDVDRIHIKLLQVPLPSREYYADQTDYGRAVENWAMNDDWAVEDGGKKTVLTLWVKSLVGPPPRMPKLKH